MYVVKVGEYYVRTVEYSGYDIVLSKEIMRGFSKTMAESLAKKLNGEVIKLQDPLGISEEASCGDN